MTPRAREHVSVAPIASSGTREPPGGDGTPTGDAIQAAIEYLSALPQNSREFIVLATDGEPSCSPSGEGQEEARPLRRGGGGESLGAPHPGLRGWGGDHEGHGHV